MSDRHRFRDKPNQAITIIYLVSNNKTYDLQREMDGTGHFLPRSVRQKMSNCVSPKQYEQFGDKYLVC